MKSPALFIVLTLLAVQTVSGTVTPPLSVIIQKVIARDDANQEELQSMEYHQHLRSEQIGADGKVTKHQDVQMIIRPGMKDEIQVLSVTGDDLSSDPDEAARKAKGDEVKRKNLASPSRTWLSGSTSRWSERISSNPSPSTSLPLSPEKTNSTITRPKKC